MGSNLVIRPIPARLRTPASSNQANLDTTTKKSKTNTLLDQDDDEMFLDADGELSAEVAIDTGLPIKRNVQNTQSQGHQHIVYKRKNAEDDTLSDYGMSSSGYLVIMVV